MDNLTELYCLMDDFCKDFEPEFNGHLLHSGNRQDDWQLSDFIELGGRHN